MGMEHQREVYEKTWFEKVEETMKTGVFGVFFLLLKDNETSVLKITIILILDFLQLEGLTVNSNVYNIYIYIYIYRSTSRGVGEA